MNPNLRLRRTTPLMVGAVLSLFAGLVQAADVQLVGAQETPPVSTTATGVASITIASDKSVSGSVKTAGIDGTMAHIHTGAPMEAGPPIITLTKGDNGAWNVPPGAKLTDGQYATFKAGNLYVNVHSAAHPGGEIRGQLKP